MKFTVSSQALTAALQVVNMALKSRTPMQILECVLIEAREDGITITGSDLTMQIASSIPCAVDECGRSAIRGSMIGEVVKKFPVGDISIDVNSKDVFSVKCGRVKSKFAGNSAVEFPVKSDFNASNTITIPGMDFCDMIASVVPCIASDDMRQVLNGGCLDVHNGNLRMVGMDGYRMAVRTATLSTIPADMRAIIPLKALSVLKKALNTIGDNLVELRFTDTDFGVSFDDTEILCSLIEGAYVNYEQIVPKQYNTSVTLDAQQLRDTVERAAMLARIGESQLIRFAVRKDTMIVCAASTTDEIVETIDAMTDGDDMDIAFNAKYMLDAAKMFDDGKVVLKMINGVSPCVISGVDDKNYFLLILPVRTTTPMPASVLSAKGESDDE